MLSGISQTNTVDLIYMWNLNKSNSYNLLRVVTRGCGPCRVEELGDIGQRVYTCSEKINKFQSSHA